MLGRQKINKRLILYFIYIIECLVKFWYLEVFNLVCISCLKCNILIRLSSLYGCVIVFV